MTIERIKLWIANIYGFCVMFPIVPIAVGLILLGLIVFGGIRSCQSNREERKINDLKEQITIDKIEGNFLSNQANTIKENVNKLQNQSANAEQNLKNASKGNLNGLDGNYENARKRFCEIYPEACQ